MMFSTDKIVSCSGSGKDDGKGDISEDLKKFCPKFKISAIIAKSEYACFVDDKEKEEFDEKECAVYGHKTKSKTSWVKKPVLSCGDGLKHIAAAGGIDKLPALHRTMFEGACCEKYGPELEKKCPKLDSHAVFDRGGHEYCGKADGSGERETKRRRKPVKNDGKKIFDKGDSYYCEIDGEAVDSFVPSEAACKG